MNRLSHTSISAPRRWGEESVPPSPSPERPPLTPHDPPDPAPQAAAWDRALRVIFMESTQSTEGFDQEPVVENQQARARCHQSASWTLKGRAIMEHKTTRAIAVEIALQTHVLKTCPIHNEIFCDDEVDPSSAFALAVELVQPAHSLRR